MPTSLTGTFPGYADVFNKLIADNTRNKLDLGSHYPYSPERWRIFVDGSRVFPEYGSVSQYNHNKDLHDLTPAANEEVVFESAERLTYVVQFELVATFAFQKNQSLQSGDRIRVGLFDGSDGWILEQNDTHADNEAKLAMFRDGSEQTSATEDPIKLKKATDKFVRYALYTGWYRLTRQLWEQSFPQKRVQKNEEIGRAAAPDGTDGPKTGNLPVHYSVKAGSGTSNLKMSAGSSGAVVLGDARELSRLKSTANTRSISQVGDWEPVLAVRADPDRKIVNTLINEVEILEFSGSGDVQLTLQAHDPSKVADSNGNGLGDGDFSTPELHSSQNSVIQESTNVAQAANSSGTVSSTASDPGGFQIGYASLYSSGNGAKTVQSANPSDQKRPLYGRDIAVFWARIKSGGGTGDITFEWGVQQDW